MAHGTGRRRQGRNPAPRWPPRDGGEAKPHPKEHPHGDDRLWRECAGSRQAWRSKLAREALKATWIQKFIGNDSDSILQVFDDTKKGAGDRVTVTLRMQLQGDGVIGDGTLEGNEEALTTYTDNLFIDQLRHAVRSAGKMTEQRIPWSIRSEAMMGLKDWWAGRMDTAFFNQVCGFTAQPDVRFTGNQAVIAPDSGHIFRPNSRANDQSLTTGDEMTLSIIDELVTAAKLGGVGVSNPDGEPVIRPVKVDGEDYYVIVMPSRPSTWTNTSSGVLDIQKAATTGDGSKNNRSRAPRGPTAPCCTNPPAAPWA